MKVFAWPLALAVVTVFGLIACLWGGPQLRWASWVALATPILAVLAAPLIRRRRVGRPGRPA